MYLKKLKLENVGPIKNLEIEPSFINENPKPLVLVGQNGSGKSIALSFIANFLLNLQQHIFDNTEIEKGKVFKLRSGIYIGPNAPYYFGSVEFTEELGLEEWFLSKPKKSLLAEGVNPSHTSWGKLTENNTDGFFTTGNFENVDRLTTLYGECASLYFPANRFEEPAWLNSYSTLDTPKISTQMSIKGVTHRKIISSNVFSTLVSWIYDVLIDAYIFETSEIEVNFQDGTKSKALLPIRTNRNWTLKKELEKVLSMLFAGRKLGDLSLILSKKPTRQISIAERQSDGTEKLIVQNISSLSSGESLLLGMFASLIRDFDLGNSEFSSLEEIKGIVLIDEIDLHLHIDLQGKVLPLLIKAFPKVQFIVTTHSPLFLLGMDVCFGPEGYDIYELPTGTKIDAEDFGEFQKAYDEYSNSKPHKEAISLLLSSTNKPYLITEGDTDKKIISIAWEKLYGTTACPIEITSSTEIIGQTGNAKHVQSALRYMATLAKTPVIGLFDNDAEGNAQFGGLKAPLFKEVSRGHKKGGSVSGLLLPVPPSRSNYVHPSKGSYCHLVIEHYFSDAILQAADKKGVEIIAGSGLFEIQGDKTAFANSVEKIEPEEFENFHLLFLRIADILGVAQPIKAASH